MAKLVMIIAPPGGGKGTQAEVLVRERGFVHLEISKIIEDKFQHDDPLDQEIAAAKEAHDRGDLIDSDLIIRWFKEKLGFYMAKGHDIVLSGNPRTVQEAETEHEIFFKEFGLDNILVFHINISVESSVKRNSSRRLCTANRHPIPSSDKYKDMAVCPWDGSALETRGVMDQPEVIRDRYQVYLNETAPVLDFFMKHNYKVVEIDGEHEIEEVSAKLLKEFDEYFIKKQRGN